ncbi:MAG: Maf family protein [Chitinophagaceae bacterium]|nr:Maf family protein [Chitinophagaceae bacterium]
MKKIVLASGSPRRKKLLERAEVDFDIIVEATDETFPQGLTTTETAIYIARQKALAVRDSGQYKRYEQKLPVLAADTIVVCEEKIIGKPEDKEDAVRILHILSGKKHEVITGVVILDDNKEISFADSTEVWFRELSHEQIVFYVEKYQPFDKAGAYAIQEWIGVVGIERINGDFYNVMGLPVSRVIKEFGNLPAGRQV